jgi:hypothetical protein
MPMGNPAPSTTIGGPDLGSSNGGGWPAITYWNRPDDGSSTPYTSVKYCRVRSIGNCRFRRSATRAGDTTEGPAPTFSVSRAPSTVGDSR